MRRPARAGARPGMARGISGHVQPAGFDKAGVEAAAARQGRAARHHLQKTPPGEMGGMGCFGWIRHGRETFGGGVGFQRS